MHIRMLLYVTQHYFITPSSIHHLFTTFLYELTQLLSAILQEQYFVMQHANVQELTFKCTSALRGCNFVRHHRYYSITLYTWCFDQLTLKYRAWKQVTLATSMSKVVVISVVVVLSCCHQLKFKSLYVKHLIGDGTQWPRIRL